MQSAFSVIFVVATLALGGTCVTQGQQTGTLPSADDVLDAFYEALGGEMAIAGIDQVRITGRSEEPMPASMELLYKDGKMLFRNSNAGQESVTGFDGKTWWRKLPGTVRPKELSGQNRAMARHFALFSPRFLKWPEINQSIEVVESISFRGNQAWQMAFTDSDGQVVDRYFDRNTGLLLASRIKTSHFEQLFIYEFKDVDGVMWVTAVTGMLTYSVDSDYEVGVEFTDFDFNARFDDGIFDMPSTESDD
ncbi:MAG: hypothetical protein ACR2NP_15655 [Pirellulaceae bacterium]